MTAVTDGSGEYRFGPLPLGTYEVTYTLEGFQSVKREAVRLTAGFTAKIDIPLKLGSLNETVTVSRRVTGRRYRFFDSHNLADAGDPRAHSDQPQRRAGADGADARHPHQR